MVNDSDEEHAETDEDSDPDSVEVSIQSFGGIICGSTGGPTPINWIVGFNQPFPLPNDWTIIIEGLEFGNKSVFRPSGWIVLVDEGIAWTIFVDYVYLTYE